MNAPLPFARHHAAIDPGWRAQRLAEASAVLAEARAVLADVAHHQDGLIRLAARVIFRQSNVSLVLARRVMVRRLNEQIAASE